MEVHSEGMVRVMHPGHGMGLEFPSRTSEQRAQVTALIDLLRNSPNQMPELIISPRALLADVKQFEPEDKHASASGTNWKIPSSNFFAAAPPCNRMTSWQNCKSSAIKHFPAPSQKAFPFSLPIGASSAT